MSYSPWGHKELKMTEATQHAHPLPEPFMALISLNAALLAQHEQVLDVFALPPKCVISLC